MNKELETAAEKYANDKGYQSDKEHFETTFWTQHNIASDAFIAGANWYAQQSSPIKEDKDWIERFEKLFQSTDTCFGDCNSEDVNICDHTGHGCGLWMEYAKKSFQVAKEYAASLQSSPIDDEELKELAIEKYPFSKYPELVYPSEALTIYNRASFIEGYKANPLHVNSNVGMLKKLIEWTDHLADTGWYRENGTWTHDDEIGRIGTTESLVRHYNPEFDETQLNNSVEVGAIELLKRVRKEVTVYNSSLPNAIDDLLNKSQQSIKQ